MEIYSTQSYMPIFHKMFDMFDIKNVLEYGIGLYSTPFFVEKCSKVISIEMNNKRPKHSGSEDNWYNIVIKLIGNKPNWKHIAIYNLEDALKYGQNQLVEHDFDLVFADGGKNRAAQTNSGFYHARFIVQHDTQISYDLTTPQQQLMQKKLYEQWNIPKSYTKIEFKNFGAKQYTYNQQYNIGGTYGWGWPETTVFCKNKNDAKIVASWLDMDENEVLNLYDFSKHVEKY